MNTFIERMKEAPVLGSLIAWAEAYPRLSAWVVLAAGMVIILLFEARDVGLEFGQWLALIVATVLVAGACIWIVSWEDEDELETESPSDAPAEADGALPAEAEDVQAESPSDAPAEADK